MSEEGEERNSNREEKRRRRLENLPHSSSENDVGCRNVALTVGRSNVAAFICDSSSESDVSAGAFRGSFTSKYFRTVAFPMVRVAFRLSEATGVQGAAREGAGSRALVSRNDSVSKTLPR